MSLRSGGKTGTDVSVFRYFKCQSNGSWAVSRETSSLQSKLIASTTAEVKKSVNSFVRSVVAMGLHIKPLPRERCIGMRLYYNPEVSFRVLGSLFWTSFSRFELASLQANAQEME